MIGLYGLTYQYGHDKVNKLIGNRKYKDLSLEDVDKIADILHKKGVCHAI